MELDYLYLEGAHFRMHEGAPAEPVPVAWGITTGGKPCWWGLSPGATESFDAWAGFLRELTGPDLRRHCWSSPTPPRFIRAVEVAFASSLRQRS